MAHTPQFVDIAHERFYRSVVQTSIGFIQDHQGRFGAGKGGKQSCEDGDLACLALREMGDEVVGSVGQVEGLEKRLHLNALAAHRHGGGQVFTEKFTPQHTVSLEHRAQCLRGVASAPFAVGDQHATVVNATRFHGKQANGCFKQR